MVQLRIATGSWWGQEGLAYSATREKGTAIHDIDVNDEVGWLSGEIFRGE